MLRVLRFVQRGTCSLNFYEQTTEIIVKPKYCEMFKKTNGSYGLEAGYREQYRRLSFNIGLRLLGGRGDDFYESILFKTFRK